MVDSLQAERFFSFKNKLKNSNGQERARLGKTRRLLGYRERITPSPASPAAFICVCTHLRMSTHQGDPLSS